MMKSRDHKEIGMFWPRYAGLIDDSGVLATRMYADCIPTFPHIGYSDDLACRLRKASIY